MEIKKLKMPPGAIHDLRYLYVIISGIYERSDNIIYNPSAISYFKRLLNEYANARADLYGISNRPRAINDDVVKNAISELTRLELVSKSSNNLSLTESGKEIAKLIKSNDKDQLKNTFTKLMLSKYYIFEYFLKRIKNLTNGAGIPIPIINSSTLKTDDEIAIKNVISKYLEMINNVCRIIPDEDKIKIFINELDLDHIPTKTKKIDALQSALEKLVLSNAFESKINSKRAYDFIRSRTTFLELTNYFTQETDGYQFETTYLISDFDKFHYKESKAVDYMGGCIYKNHPPFDVIVDRFKSTISEVYKDRKDEFGYAKVGVMRDFVCRKLEISDSTFDDYIKLLYKSSPSILSFTYAGASDKITEKRLPIIMDGKNRELLTLMKIYV